MRKTKKVTLSAMMVALGTVLLLIGAVFEMLDLAMGAITSIIMIFVFIELGSPYTWLVWLATSLCAFLTGISNPMAAVWYFLLFGLYPIIKAFIERLSRKIWILLKLAYAAALFAAVIGVYRLIFGISPFALESEIISAVIIVLGAVCFVVYDLFITAVSRAYILKYRKRFSKLLK